MFVFSVFSKALCNVHFEQCSMYKMWIFYNFLLNSVLISINHPNRVKSTCWQLPSQTLIRWNIFLCINLPVSSGSTTEDLIREDAWTTSTVQQRLHSESDPNFWNCASILNYSKILPSCFWTIMALIGFDIDVYVLNLTVLLYIPMKCLNQWNGVSGYIDAA